ncbi:MAG: acyltransferase family protein [Catenulispora sp.]
MEAGEGAWPLPRRRFAAWPGFAAAAAVSGADADAGIGAGAGGGPGPKPEPKSGPNSESKSEPIVSARVAALDGLRALAVVAVLLYHAGVARVPGGFLGVDVFFVLSGYLITGLLAREYLATGAVVLRRFYQRRARRLLPALFAVIAGVCVLVIMRLPGEAAGFRDDAAASLLYVTNWWFVARGQSYFGGTGRPSLVLHLWSLAVEEQFYLVWPAFLMVALGRLPGAGHAERVRALWRAVGWATLLSACSIGLTVLLYSPWRDQSRVYYGTDTRAFELLIGVMAALVQLARGRAEAHSETQAETPVENPVENPAENPAEPPARSRTPRRAVTEIASFASLAGVLWAFAAVPATSSRLYPVGLIALSVAAAVLIRTLVAGTAIADLLAAKPLVWLGERSYALYLWHWPVFDVTRPGVDLAWPPEAVFVLRVLLSLLLATLSYRFVETPIRHGALGRIAERARTASRDRRPALPLATAGAAFAMTAAVAMLADALLVTAAAHPANPRAAAVDDRPATALTATPRATDPHPGSGPESAPTYPTALPPPPEHPPRVALIGDSQGMTLALNRPPDTAAYLTLLDDTTEGCGLLGGRISSRVGDRRDLDAECGHAPAAWAQRVRHDHADIAVLMIGAWDLFDEHVDGAELPFGTPAWDAYFGARLGRAVDALNPTGLAQLDLALLPCYRPFRPAGGSGGLWPERGDDTRVAHVNMLLSRYAEAVPASRAAPHRIRTLYPPPEFCQDSTIGTSRSYRWDGVHYYKPGARLYLRTAIPQLLAP